MIIHRLFLSNCKRYPIFYWFDYEYRNLSENQQVFKEDCSSCTKFFSSIATRAM